MLLIFFTSSFSKRSFEMLIGIRKFSFVWVNGDITPKVATAITSPPVLRTGPPLQPKVISASVLKALQFHIGRISTIFPEVDLGLKSWGCMVMSSVNPRIIMLSPFVTLSEFPSCTVGNRNLFCESIFNKAISLEVPIPIGSPEAACCAKYDLFPKFTIIFSFSCVKFPYSNMQL